MEESTGRMVKCQMNLFENFRNKLLVTSKPSLAPEEVEHLEAALQDVFVPVTPRRDFVERLNRQLITSGHLPRKQPVTISDQEQKTRETLLIGAATLLGAAAIFAAGFRVALTLLGAVGILVQWLHRKSTDKQTPVQPAV